MCPPHVDQTTRTSPIWQLLSPETKQVLPPWDYSSSLGNPDILKATFGTKPPLFDAWALLARPVLPQPSSTSETRQYKFHEPSSGFTNLSNEIIDIIYSHILPNKEDALSIALAIDSQRVWQILFRRLHRTYLELAAPLAGKSIIFQCSWVTELPRALKVQKELVENLAPQGRKIMCEARRFFWKHTDFESPKTNDEESLEWTSALEKHLDVEEGLGRHLLTQLRSEKYFPEGEWVLRNHTTRQYVTSQYPQPNGQPDFTTILMMRNTWGIQGDSDKGLTKFGIGNGKWAGSRMDIITREVFEEEKTGRWKDLTKEVNAEYETGRAEFEAFGKTKQGSYFLRDDDL
jgi:hypothetical protein